jgi:hypothetical protein
MQASDSTIIGSDSRRIRKDIEGVKNMTDQTPVSGGFTGDPDAALAVTGTGGCCGSSAATTSQLVGPSPCCGTSAQASAEGSCCGSTAKTEAVAAGQACCG